MLKVKLNDNFNQQTEIVLSLKYLGILSICDKWLKTKMNKIIFYQQHSFKRYGHIVRKKRGTFIENQLNL